ncbi:MAG: NADH-quinone oxidoreductase subunit A [Runella sp.]
MLNDFGLILLFILAAMVFITLILTIAKFIRPHHPNPEKLTTYESGEDPLGNANVQFNVRFYVIALIFVLFEVELVFLFPWAVVFGQANLIAQTDGLWGWFSLVEMLVFVGILAIGLAYAWVKGYLDWAKPRPQLPEVKSQIPPQLYQNINQKYASKQTSRKV